MSIRAELRQHFCVNTQFQKTKGEVKPFNPSRYDSAYSILGNVQCRIYLNLIFLVNFVCEFLDDKSLGV